MYVGRSHNLRLQRMAFKAFFFLIFVPLIAYIFFQVPLLYLSPFFAIGLIILVYRFFDWYADGWVLTNQGILDIKWGGFFHHQCLRLNYDDIRGVTYETNGVIPSVFGYGDVTMLMASGGENILREAAKPAKLQKKILDIKNKLALDNGKTEFDIFRNAMHKMLGDFLNKKEDASEAVIVEKEKRWHLGYSSLEWSYCI